MGCGCAESGRERASNVITLRGHTLTTRWRHRRNAAYSNDLLRFPGSSGH